MKKVWLYFSMCICFVSTMFFGAVSTEAKIYIESDEKAQLSFSPQFHDNGDLYFGDFNNPWGFASKTNYLEQENIAFYLDPRFKNFNKFEVSGSVYRVSVSDYLDRFGERDDMSGYISVDANEDTAIKISSTRTSKRFDPCSSHRENTKLAASSYLGNLARIALEMKSSINEKGITNVHPVLRFDAVLIEGNETSNFTMGMNANYLYQNNETGTSDTGYEFYKKINYVCKTYGNFELPLNAYYIDNTKFFIDVDSDLVDVPTTYKFKNFRIVLERYVSINSFDPNELRLLDGIGEVLA